MKLTVFHNCIGNDVWVKFDPGYLERGRKDLEGAGKFPITKRIFIDHEGAN
jgi:hypothetical protein